ncbi:flagella basal body P-ring formation protein FlgA [Rhizobium sp. PP-F2F-G48]|uniref:flagellar basal body P-ring formation chaperone FlgA n=1 Tax=Rhizobium sp. PP-F2F-G48 TaxID=2135651 RepID=UPI0010DC9C6F|nr:flagellar basal body P-ring formation chaperone FlgA [Rhizobium sp. PP-F2F-G48]TCM56027.1 flagella basal body P-ring formation protein FlgA [Rhizobium sp. PP-F2F-G48]
MMFRPMNRLRTVGSAARIVQPALRRLMATMLCAAALSTMTITGANGQAGSQTGVRDGAQPASKTAVIPTETIYPGQTIEEGHLQVVAVTNPDLSGDYASGLEEVVGKITNRTLLAGRVIFVAGLREPYAVERGKAVRIVYSNGSLTISAGGSPLDNAAVGDLIRIRNTDSGMIVSGTVMADGTVHVVAK